MLYLRARSNVPATLAFALGAMLGPPIAASAAHSPTPHATIQDLGREMTLGWANAHPLEATAIGLADEDGRLDTPSAAENATDLAQIRTWQRELDAILVSGASLADVDDVKLLRARLIGMERGLTVYRRFQKDYTRGANAVVDGLFTQFEHLPQPGIAGATAADRTIAWQRIVTRLAAAPAYIGASEAMVTTPGKLFGTVGAQQVAGSVEFLTGALSDAAKAQLDPAELAQFTTARDATVASLKATKAYVDAHAATWPDNYAIGAAAYDAMLHDEQLLPFDRAQIAQMAADELAHGWAERAWIHHLAKHDAAALGPTSGGGLAPGGAALVGYYRTQIATLTAFMKAQHVVAVPAWLGAVDVVETPPFLQPVTPGASMQAPLLLSKQTTGFYYITPPKSLAEAAARMDPNEDFDRDRILQTGAHEAMPGHFMQLSIARRNPDFVRATEDSGVFAEGWAYYGEEMFLRLGLYGADLDPQEDAAQWERVRGARCVVDGKLASGEWSYEKAATYFADETGFPRASARAAVAGIALSPGYVISYTVGRYQLENLQTQYDAKMGDKGSLYDFNTRLLSYGTTPFAVVGPELLAGLDTPLTEVQAAANY